MPSSRTLVPPSATGTSPLTGDAATTADFGTVLKLSTGGEVTGRATGPDGTTEAQPELAPPPLTAEVGSNTGAAGVFGTNTDAEPPLFTGAEDGDVSGVAGTDGTQVLPPVHAEPPPVIGTGVGAAGVGAAGVNAAGVNAVGAGGLTGVTTAPPPLALPLPAGGLVVTGLAPALNTSGQPAGST